MTSQYVHGPFLSSCGRIRGMSSYFIDDFFNLKTDLIDFIGRTGNKHAGSPTVFK
jgi:hypothetical protein